MVLCYGPTVINCEGGVNNLGGGGGLKMKFCNKPL